MRLLLSLTSCVAGIDMMCWISRKTVAYDLYGSKCQKCPVPFAFNAAQLRPQKGIEHTYTRGHFPFFVAMGYQ